MLADLRAGGFLYRQTRGLRARCALRRLNASFDGEGGRV